ncbi:MAG: aromatic ring-hydroxylating dioxygenase subunit alpha [Burkholderiales bacterium]|nr:aromatic ring-hydroxylating dioxygenase subunit alpha [Burkholderiales bacterium]
MNAIVEMRKTEAGIDSLLQEVARIGALPLDRSETLPTGAYTSEAFFDLEVERLFKPGWVSVAHVSQLPNKGDYLSLNLFGELVVIVNDGDAIRALSRVCLHRWAPICEGNGNAGSFVCPFHKWAYRLDGRLIGAPLMEEAADFHPESCSLPAFRSEVVDGFVFVNIDGTAEPLRPALAEMSDLLKNYQMDRMVIGSVLQYECAFNWKIMVETFMECYHHIGPHAATFEPEFPARISYVEDGRPAWTRGFGVARPEIVPDVFDVGLPRFPLVNAKECESFGLYLAYPSHIIATFPDRVVWFDVQPVGAALTRLTAYQFVQPEAKAMEGFDQEMAVQTKVWDVINREDIEVNTMQQIGAQSGYVKPGRLSHLEKAIWQLGQFVATKVAAPQSARHR